MNTAKFTTKTIRTKWVQQWTAAFLKELATVSGKDQIESYCQARKADYERTCQERAKNPEGWKNTAASYMSQIRRAIGEWQETIELDQTNSYPQQTKAGVVNQHLALLYMNYPSDFHKERMAPTNTRKQEQRRNLETISDVDAYQGKIDGLLESREWRELAAGLIAATGRRPSEILKTAEFEQIGKYEVAFSGQLKTKGEEREAYSTYTLVESAKVVNGLARLRRMPEIKEVRKQTLAQMDSGKNSTLNSIIRESFEGFINPPYGEKQLSAKNLRASYAAIAIYLFCPWKQSTNQFITERLGHTSDATATNYEDYQVCDRQGKPLTRGAWVERIDEEMEIPKMAKILNTRIRITQADREVLDDEEFLPGDDLASRMSELIRLARLGKALESGEIRVSDCAASPSENRASNSPDSETQPESKELQPVQPDGNDEAFPLSSIPSEELFSSHRPGSAREKIRRVVAAIKSYNSSQYEKSTQWAINSGVIKALTNINSKAIKEYLNSDEGRLQVTDYNALHGFSFHHNRGREKPITEFVRIA